VYQYVTDLTSKFLSWHVSTPEPPIQNHPLTRFNFQSLQSRIKFLKGHSISACLFSDTNAEPPGGDDSRPTSLPITFSGLPLNPLFSIGVHVTSGDDNSFLRLSSLSSSAAWDGDDNGFLSVS
jgi:hypothetical protein